MRYICLVQHRAEPKKPKPRPKKLEPIDAASVDDAEKIAKTMIPKTSKIIGVNREVSASEDGPNLSFKPL